MSTTNFADPDQIIRIPARELTGTREAKLAELDTLLAQLQLVRLALCGEPVHIDWPKAQRGDARAGGC